MSLNPYLNFDGNTREVVLYYASIFGLEEPAILTFGSNPQSEIPPGTENLVMHTQLKIAGSTLMFSDNFPGRPFRQGNNFSLAYVSSDKDAIKDAFDKLKQCGKVELELQETSWSPYYGYLTDKYGVGWQFNYES
ncbi:VOC family protein [Paenibacillus sp. 1011MAR3C5]|uniref:VOC family protein n=1 Tax=Paenibacillus sp. 1011MAR3C5 TaxID=1675787 RepID=UPI000E6C82BB|nr:VOC family protein [Paenibacillus sp. 1011MAR3C5]RJE89647.1 VOC family protein [Paenibacillus sp. 1011MAR3C5]